MESDCYTRKGNGCLIHRPTTPHFFKIILDDAIQSGKLLIPGRFVRMYGNDLSSPVILTVPGGAKWKVELVKCDGETWFQKGWQEFLQYYSLSRGSFLVFEYNRNSDFKIIIFDKSASEIDYPSDIVNQDMEANPDKESQEQKLNENDSDVSVEILTHCSQSPKAKKNSLVMFSQSSKKIKLGNSIGQSGGNAGNRRTHSLTPEEKATALTRASSNFKSSNPFFMVAMQRTYVHFPHKLGIPAKFVQKYFNKQSKNVILRTVEGKLWSVIYSYNLNRGQATAKLSHGWNQFSKENSLEIGDVCVFELINRSDYVPTLKVVIFRSTEAAIDYPLPGNGKQLKHEEGSTNFNQSIKPGSLNPCFEAQIRTLRHPVNVPIEFVLKCTNKSTEKVTLQVESRRWPVKLINNSFHKRGWLSAGWTLFVKENSLQRGDVCMFELINPEILLLQVSVSKNNVK